jgi:hypothetical protein
MKLTTKDIANVIIHLAVCVLVYKAHTHSGRLEQLEAIIECYQESADE